jgi:hypothetical protein
MTSPDMDDEAMKAMARRICASVCGGDAVGRAAAREFLRGDADDESDMRIALAAIIETQRLDAGLADSMTLEMPGISIGLADGASLARRQIATAIRAGQHYGKDRQ